GDDHPLPAQRVDHGQEVGGKILGRIRRRNGPLALAVAALIERDDVEAVDERARDPVEPVGVCRSAVEHEQPGTGRVAPLERVQGDLAGLEGTVTRGRAREWTLSHRAIVPISALETFFVWSHSNDSVIV